eukprot:1130233-Amphidinium_carterae.1
MHEFLSIDLQLCLLVMLADFPIRNYAYHMFGDALNKCSSRASVCGQSTYILQHYDITCTRSSGRTR